MTKQSSLLLTIFLFVCSFCFVMQCRSFFFFFFELLVWSWLTVWKTSSMSEARYYEPHPFQPSQEWADKMILRGPIMLPTFGAHEQADVLQC